MRSSSSYIGYYFVCYDFQFSCPNVNKSQGLIYTPSLKQSICPSHILSREEQQSQNLYGCKKINLTLCRVQASRSFDSFDPCGNDPYGTILPQQFSAFWNSGWTEIKHGHRQTKNRVRTYKYACMLPNDDLDDGTIYIYLAG